VRVYIITEAGKNIGFGHLTRCLSLYQSLKEKKLSPHFILNADNSVKNLLKINNYQIFNWLTKQERLFNTVENADVIIVDSYLADLQFYYKISTIAKIPLYIDDNRRIDYPKGTVINGSMGARGLDYPQKKEVNCLLGRKFILLRKEFWKASKKDVKKNMETAMISFGGIDLRNMTPKALKLLRDESPQLTKKVVIGKGFKNTNRIKRVKDNKTELIYYPDAVRMKQIMLESDIAISSGGQTVNELARIGVPTITVATTENQQGNIKGLEKSGFLKYAGLWKDDSLLDNIRLCLKNYRDFKTREKSYKIGRKLIDGKGSRLIADYIINSLKENIDD